MKNITERFLMEDYLTDESQLKGRADIIYLPETTADVKKLSKDEKITISAGRTGIYGASIPDGGGGLSTQDLNKITGLCFRGDYLEITCQSGLTLENLEIFLKTKSSDFLSEDFADLSAISALDGNAFFFPVFPSEKSATLGGIFATNAKGIGGSFYDGGRRWIKEKDTVNFGDETKLFLELTLTCIKNRKETWGIMFFFLTKEEAISFGKKCKEISSNEETNLVETVYLAPAGISLINQEKNNNLNLKVLPELPSKTSAGIYCEIHGENDDECESFLEKLLELYIESGGDDEDTWALYGEEKNQIHQILHSMIELEATLLGVKDENGQSRFSCDYEIPLENYEDFARVLEETAESEKIKYNLFGYYQRNHLHFALLPQTQLQISKIKDIFLNIEKYLKDFGAEVSEEYGFGRLKKRR